MAAGWGFAEATCFFIVPDVWLSLAALSVGKRIWAACLWTAAGALVGGSIMFAWGWWDAATAKDALLWIPEVNEARLATVNEQVDAHGVLAVLLGPLRGIPYKIYAVELGARGVNPILFIAASLPARLTRFLLVTAGSLAFSRLARRLSLRARRGVVLVFWILFYAVRFSGGDGA